MADWTDYDPNDLLPGEPWTAALALAAFENPEAIAEGAPGAPRVWTEAFGTLLEEVDPASETVVAFTDLSFEEYTFQFVRLRQGVASDLQFSWSADNGAAYSAWRDLTSFSASGADFGGTFRVQTRSLSAISAVGTMSAATFNTNSLFAYHIGGWGNSDPINAVRFRWSTGTFAATADQRIRVWSTSMGVARA